jgi:hypothetical protein
MKCKSQAISPKGFSVKTPFNSRRTSKIIQRASLALLRDRIHFHWRNKASLLQRIQELEDFIKSSLAISDQQRIFTAVECSFRKIFNKQKQTHIRKFSALNNQQNRPTPVSASNKFVLNLSEHTLTDAEEAVLMKGLNFSIIYPHSNLDMACTVESVVSKLPQTLGMEFGWKIRSMLEKSKSTRPNVTTKELKAVNL